jgi:DNA-binding Lrp family transcriptional regulator
MRDSSPLDGLDRAVVHALQIDGRVPFSRVAEVLGTSTQTVARRYQRLRAEHGLRIVGLPDPAAAGRQQWMLRLTAASATAHDVARALARRADTSWVRLTSGGTEIVAIVHTAAAGDAAHSLLLHDIPRTAGITAVSAHQLLHLYYGGPTGWRGRAAALTQRQAALLRPPGPGEPAGRFPVLGTADEPLLTALLADGRASYSQLATATGWSAATVARRLTELRDRGALFFDLDVDPAPFGVTTQALLWMSVAPAHLDTVATTLAGHDELALVAATTGPTNLIANALCADTGALHRYLTRRLALDQITALETAPVLRTLKGAGPAPWAGR